MRKVRNCVIFIVIFSLMLSTLGYAAPIDDIIETRPGGSNFHSNNDFENIEREDANLPSVDSMEDEGNGDFIVNIINTIIGWCTSAFLYPLVKVLGPNTIPKIIFNYEPLVRLSFFDTSGDGMAGKLMEVIAPIYVAFRYIAIICYVMIILYLAIRMLLSTVGKQKAMYKQLIQHWLTGVLILLTFNWLMTYTIVLSDSLVQILAESVRYGENVEGFTNTLGEFKDIMKLGIVAIVYMLVLIGMTLAVWWTYIKRLFTVALLIMVFPLITITYVFDKIGDRKSQILSAWTKEFMQNVFIQPIQAIALVLILMGMQAVDVHVADKFLIGPILKVVLLFMLFPAEALLKKIFDVNPSINGKGFAGAGAGLIGGLALANTARKTLGNNISNFREVKDAKKELKTMKKTPGMDGTKIAEQQKKIKEMRGRAYGELGGSLALGFGGAGLSGSLAKGLAYASGGDAIGGKIGMLGAKPMTRGAINRKYDELIDAINSPDGLTEEQAGIIAKDLKISKDELARTLGKSGGKENIIGRLNDNREARLDAVQQNATSAKANQLARAQEIKIKEDATFSDGSSLGTIVISKNGMTAGDAGGNIKLTLTDKDGNAIKHANFSSLKDVTYKVEVGDTEEIKLCETQIKAIEEVARTETFKRSKQPDLMTADQATQDAYIAGEGAKDYAKQYSKALEAEEAEVIKMREVTGQATLQVKERTSSVAAVRHRWNGTPSSGSGGPDPAATTKHRKNNLDSGLW